MARRKAPAQASSRKPQAVSCGPLAVSREPMTVSRFSLCPSVFVGGCIRIRNRWNLCNRWMESRKCLQTPEPPGEPPGESPTEPPGEPGGEPRGERGGEPGGAHPLCETDSRMSLRVRELGGKTAENRVY